MKSPFRATTNRRHLESLESDIMSLAFETQRHFGCSDSEIASVLITAAEELAHSDTSVCAGFAADSFDHHLIEACARYLGRFRAKQC